MAKKETTELDNSKFHRKTISKQYKKLEGSIKTENLLKWIILLLHVDFMKIAYVTINI